VENIRKDNFSVYVLWWFNGLLLMASWIMAFYAYPRLPARIPYWLNLAGTSLIKLAKSPFFFLYPIFQTAFVLVIWFARQNWIKKPEFQELQTNNEEKPEALKKISSSIITPSLLKKLQNLKKEIVLLFMIFINLIFIHLERSLIWLAHNLSAGVNKYYFFSLLIILLLLVPYYRFRRSLLIKMETKQ
jgi:hypothetical protein